MTGAIKSRIGITAGFIVIGAVLLTPKSVPHWLWVIEGIALNIVFMAGAAVSAVMWERYGPNGCRLHEWEATRAAQETVHLLRTGEYEDGQPATFHYPEGGGLR